MWLHLSPAEEDKHHKSWGGLETASPHTSGSSPASLMDHVLGRAMQGGPGSTLPPRDPC